MNQNCCQLRWNSGAKVTIIACCTEQRNKQYSGYIKDKRKYFTIDTQQNQLLAHYVNQKAKTYDTSHSGLSLKIKHCSIFGKIKKNYLQRVC